MDGRHTPSVKSSESLSDGPTLIAGEEVPLRLLSSRAVGEANVSIGKSRG